MTVKDFINEYKKLGSDNLKEAFLRKHVFKKYIPYSEKMAICSAVVKATSYSIEKDETGKEIDRKIKLDSPARNLFGTMELIRSYTDLDILMKNAVESYDALAEVGLIDLIIDKIPERERDEFVDILEMTLDDFIQNNTTLEAIVSTQVKRFSTLLGSFVKPVFGPMLDEYNKLSNEEKKALVNGIIEIMRK